MHTIKHIYEPLLNKEYIIHIIDLAAKGKKKRGEVQTVLANKEYYADQILNMLQTGYFKLLPYHHKTITEKGKKRELTISPFFPNRILDYIVVETLKPYIRKSMYHYCIGNVDKRGITFGVEAIKKHYRQYKYYIQLDIKKYYPSVKSETLCKFIETKVKDEQFMKLCRAVVTQCDDLPIGSYYSQWFSNWYLQDIDYKIKQQLKIPFYVRYVDDMLLMGNNKRKLLNAMYNVNRILDEKGLSLKHFPQVKQWEIAPIDFLGFRFGNIVKARKAMFRRLTKVLRKVNLRRFISVEQARTLLAYLGWMKYTTYGYMFYKNNIKPLAPKGALRRIISNYDRRLKICPN